MQYEVHIEALRDRCVERPAIVSVSQGIAFHLLARCDEILAHVRHPVVELLELLAGVLGQLAGVVLDLVPGGGAAAALWGRTAPTEEERSGVLASYLSYKAAAAAEAGQPRQ